MNGYAGKFLKVDLTKGICSIFTIEEARLKKFIGGSSLAASLYLEDLIYMPTRWLRKARSWS
jgi:aldehyde:ferredoxin oxidoreductase